jgi:hypothetical protein
VNLFFNHQGDEGHKGKKAKKNPSCTFVTLRGKVFRPETEAPLFFHHQGDEGAQREKAKNILCVPL